MRNENKFTSNPKSENQLDLTLTANNNNNKPSMVKKIKKACCVYCGKEETYPISLYQHTQICKLTKSTSSNQKKKDWVKEKQEEIMLKNEPPSMIPSQEEMWKMIQHLNKKVEDTERKLESFQLFMNKTKKKINVLEYLQTEYSPSITWECFVSELIENSIQTYDFLNNHLYIFLSILFEKASSKALTAFNPTINSTNPLYHPFPLRVFSLSPQFYLYSANTWRMITPQDWKIFIDILLRCLMNYLNKWKETIMEEGNTCEKKRERNNIDKIDEIYNKKMCQLMISPKDTILTNKIKTILSNYVKVDVKKIMEYEWTL
jgi:hypothetical protein